MNDIGEDDRAVRRPIPAPSWCRRNRGMIRKMAPIGVAMLLASAAMPAQASDATQSTFGTLPDGRAVPAVMLSNANGVSATVIAYGATLQSVILPDKDGNTADVALSTDNPHQYPHKTDRATCRARVC